jgi:sulfate/thiosulfate transport system permease protein
MVAVRSVRQQTVIPGFGLTLGITLSYLGLIVILPLCVMFFRASDAGWVKFWAELSSSRTLAAFRVSFGIACLAALINAVFGSVVAWVLVRYEFPGRRLVDSLIDLPFALPTAVAGIALTSLYSAHGWLGGPLAAIGVKAAFTPVGILIALVFVGLPFVVRTVEPVLLDFDRELEESAAMLGASRLSILRRVVFPPLLPAAMTGFTLAFARAVGEYGSIVFISGNMPMRTEIVPLLIVTKLEQYDYEGATALAVVMLTGSFLLLLIINLLQAWTRRGRRG